MNSPLPKHDYRRTIFTTMKDEAPYMLDWMAYHLAIGFTHFVIYTNDCSDGTEKIARNLEAVGLVTQKNNPSPFQRGPQKDAYRKMRTTEAFAQAEWLMTLDVDEYLRIDIKDGHLDDLFAAIPNETTNIAFVWQLFGNAGVRTIVDAPVIAQFTRAGQELQARPYEAMPIKTLFKNGIYQKLGTHRPVDPDPEKAAGIFWIDADGVPLPQYHRARHWRAYENGLGFGTVLGRINHYALRSQDGFFVKWARGFVHPDAPTVRGKGSAVDYWRLFDWNDREERRILRQLEAASAIKAEMMALPKIARLHDQAVQWHQERAKALRASGYDAIETEINALDESAPLPDFSAHGCPPHPQNALVPISNLRRKLAYSSLDHALTKDAYPDENSGNS